MISYQNSEICRIHDFYDRLMNFDEFLKEIGINLPGLTLRSKVFLYFCA